MFNYFTVIALVTANLLALTLPIQAEGIEGESNLCKQRNLVTTVALSTKKYGAAICFDNSSNSGYYVGQSKNTNDRIFLPLLEQYEPQMGTVPFKLENGGLTYKAINGPYTYQIFLKANQTCGTGEWASLTVFKNGSKLYHQKVNKFLSSSDC